MKLNIGEEKRTICFIFETEKEAVLFLLQKQLYQIRDGLGMLFDFCKVDTDLISIETDLAHTPPKISFIFIPDHIYIK